MGGARLGGDGSRHGVAIKHLREVVYRPFVLDDGSVVVEERLVQSLVHDNIPSFEGT